MLNLKISLFAGCCQLVAAVRQSCSTSLSFKQRAVNVNRTKRKVGWEHVQN